VGKDKPLEDALTEAVSQTARRLSSHGPFNLQWERYLERDPHPQGQEAFTVRVQFPWQQSPLKPDKAGNHP